MANSYEIEIDADNFADNIYEAIDFEYSGSCSSEI